MSRVIGITEASRNFSKLVNQADEHGEPIFLTRFNKPKAVLIGYQAFERLLEEMEDLEDSLAIYQRRGEPSQPFEEFLAELEEEEREGSSEA